MLSLRMLQGSSLGGCTPEAGRTRRGFDGIPQQAIRISDEHEIGHR